MAVSFQTKNSGDVCVLSPEGKIVIGDEVGALREKIKELLEGGNKNILINLANVSYIDSTGVGALVGSFTTIRNQGWPDEALELEPEGERHSACHQVAHRFRRLRERDGGNQEFCSKEITSLLESENHGEIKPGHEPGFFIVLSEDMRVGKASAEIERW